MTTRGWARITDRIADVLRRGAWYPVVDENGRDVILQVADRRVRLSRDDLTLRPTAPERWSVVVRTGVLRPTLGGARGAGERKSAGKGTRAGKGNARKSDAAAAGAAASDPGLGVVGQYAVCPFCAERQEFKGKPVRMTCAGCGKEAAVDWTEVC